MYNPVKYIDPSGNKYCDGEQPDDCRPGHHDDDIALPQQEYTHPTSNNGIDGEEMHQLFLLYQEKYGSDFTLEDFVGLMLLLEMANHEDGLGWLTEAYTRRMWNQNPGIYCGTSNTCYIGALNFMAAFSASAKSRVNNYIDKNLPVESLDLAAGANFREQAYRLGYRALHPSLNWRRKDPNRPYNFGNTYYIKDTQKGRDFNKLPDKFGSLTVDSQVVYKIGY